MDRIELVSLCWLSLWENLFNHFAISYRLSLRFVSRPQSHFLIYSLGRAEERIGGGASLQPSHYLVAALSPLASHQFGRCSAESSIRTVALRQSTGSSNG